MKARQLRSDSRRAAVKAKQKGKSAVAKDAERAALDSLENLARTHMSAEELRVLGLDGPTKPPSWDEFVKHHARQIMTTLFSGGGRDTISAVGLAMIGAIQWRKDMDAYLAWAARPAPKRKSVRRK